ncbi:hypothetical protein DFJ77DRAFT_481389 [Powellomyces hirtus]|nr:hypothetical protein DFJ77DRAFT_481389 [Powellomyces hirtus]
MPFQFNTDVLSASSLFASSSVGFTTKARTIYSFVGFINNRICLVGQGANHQSLLSPYTLIYDAKSHNFSDEGIHENMQRWPSKVIYRDDKPAIQVMVNSQDKGMRPEDVLAKIIRPPKTVIPSLVSLSSPVRGADSWISSRYEERGNSRLAATCVNFTAF